MYGSIQQLRERTTDLHEQLLEAEEQRDADRIQRMRNEISITENSLLEKNEERLRARYGLASLPSALLCFCSAATVFCSIRRVHFQYKTWFC